MSEYVPEFMRSDFLAPKASEWLSAAPKRDPTTLTQRGNTSQTIAVLTAKFEMFFPRMIDRLYSGETLNQILKEYPDSIEKGAFMRWVKKDPLRFGVYVEAKETRTEIWTGEIVQIARGEEEVPMEMDRAKFLVDTLKWLIKAENRKGYGESKQIELTGNISVVAAMQQATTRVNQLSTFEDDDEEEPTVKQLAEAIETDWEEVDNDD